MKLSKILIMLLFTASLSYGEAFKISDIRVSGLQRITVGDFFNYLPIKRGAVVDDSDYSNIIRTLYKTDFFKDVNLSRDGNVLAVTVEERPIIGQIEITGNKELKKKSLLEGLSNLGLGEGGTFDESKLAKVKKSLLDLYYSRSKFDVIIDVKVSPLAQNRVALNITIQEGISARIKQINIVGNKAFSQDEIIQKMNLTTSKWYSLLTKGDQYSGEKLKADVVAIENFYYNRGYLEFQVNSTQVSFTDDKRFIYITINISEGLPYRIDGNVFSSTQLLSKKRLNNLLTYSIGDYYSRQAARDSQKRIKNALGEKGYAFAKVNIVPRIDKSRHSIVMAYDLILGRKTYVRRIEFTGNYKTNDEVLRREMRQFESAPYNHAKLIRSGERLRRLNFISSVKRSERPVDGHPDQVDVEYKIVETASRYISAGIGYGTSSGLLFNLGYNADNFLGTGNKFTFDFSTSHDQNYAITFTDPYFTADGVSRAFELYYNKTNASKNDIGDWQSDNLGLFLRFGFPVNEYESFSIGGGYRRTNIKTGSSVTPEIPIFLAKHGDSFNEYVVDFHWTHDTRDKTVFSTNGAITRFNAELVTPGSTEEYYKLNVRNRTYFRLSDKLLMSVRGDISYSDSYGESKEVPFFRHYYAGGLTTVRGFKSSSLGPKWSNDEIKGGTFRVAGGAEIILPWTLGQDYETVRLGLFADFGNVYNNYRDFDAGEFRYSAGFYVLWRSPIGPLNLSYGIPLNAKKGDETERFQFTIGVPL
ncbi:MAG: outer membrane protein assembly factor BamA [Ostreibacterium sp.]